MKLSVVIVNYNVKYFTAQCIDSVRKATDGIDSEIIVVDNHSRDGSVDYLSKIKGIRLVESMSNLGFSKANNIAIKQSKGEYVLMLNPDTIVAEDAISQMLDFADNHPDAGGVGARMRNYNGTLAPESRRGLPSPATSLWKMLGLCKRYPGNHRFGKYYMGWLPWDSEQKIEVVSGACFLLRRKALDEVGLLDEDFFMYGEDIDLSYRLLKGGWQNWFVPADIIHYKGESTQKSSFSYVHVFYNAMLIFMRKHYSHLAFPLIWMLQTAVYGIAAMAMMKTMAKMTRLSLGFSHKSQDGMPLWWIDGDDEKVFDACRKITLKRGLDCEMKREKPSGEAVRVFDSSTTSYADMIKSMTSVGGENKQIGIYHPQLNIIITPQEVYG